MINGFGGRIVAGFSMVAAAIPLLAVAPGAPNAAAQRAAVRQAAVQQEVIVRASSPQAAHAAVAAVGGRVIMAIPLIDAVAADVPASGLSTLAAEPGVLGVTPDRQVTVADASNTAGSGMTVAGTPSVYRSEVGANTLAARGDTGAGATVALIDTGVSAGPDLAGRLVTGLENPNDPNGPPVDCINFTGDGTCSDGFGHGTFMAGLIAGTGAESGGAFAGVAPGARIVNIKIAGADGSTDLVRVLAGLDWAVSFRQQYGISVINLSLGTVTNSSPANDPLDLAVEQAWNDGVAVITSAGNQGPSAGTITAPGDDPEVITVGATNDLGTPSPADDQVAPYSSRGPTAAGLAKPDVVAPGSYLIGLQSPGSVVSAIATEADLTAPNFDGAYRRGSGTSMAAAVTSGVAALLYSAWSTQPGFSPGNWPNRLKAALDATASPVATTDPTAVGAGLVDAATAVNSAATGNNNRAGSGRGEGQWNPSTWYNGPFATNGQDWEGQSWEGQSWEGQSWEGQSWEGQSWEGQSWEGQSWEGQSWEGQSWEGQSWEAAYWG